jgi:DNA polymerase-3 subunit epsilon
VIHELLSLTRPLIIPDVETTGLDTNTARIVELAFQVYTSEGLKHEWRSLIDPGVPIPPETTKAHGITDADVTARCRVCRMLAIEHPYEPPEGERCDEWKSVPRFDQIAARIAVGFSNCDFAGKNVRYDLRVLDASFKRVNVAWSYAGACVIDADRLEQLGEPRTLSHLYEKHTGEKLEDAHQALNDVRATVVVIDRQLQRYETLPRDLRELHELQWPGWIDSDGKFRFDDTGVPRITFGKHRSLSMREVPPGYYRWLMSNDFPPDVKYLADEALNGRFPKRHSVG